MEGTSKSKILSIEGMAGWPVYDPDTVSQEVEKFFLKEDIDSKTCIGYDLLSKVGVEGLFFENWDKADTLQKLIDSVSPQIRFFELYWATKNPPLQRTENGIYLFDGLNILGVQVNRQSIRPDLPPVTVEVVPYDGLLEVKTIGILPFSEYIPFTQTVKGGA